MRQQALQPLQHAEVGRHADVDLLHGEERVGRADAQVARRGEIERAADAGALHRADDRKARAVERVERGHQAAQLRLEREPLARVAGVQHGLHRAVGGEGVERHAGAEVPAFGAQDQHARGAGVVQRLHRVAQRRKERRRHRVHALGAVQDQFGDAAGGVVVDAEEIVHGAMRGTQALMMRGSAAFVPAPSSSSSAAICCSVVIVTGYGLASCTICERMSLNVARSINDSRV